MAWELSSGTGVSLLTLTALEVVLGIDNVIFIAILAGRLPPDQRDKARKLGLAGALVTRLMLLSLLAFLAHLTEPLATVAGFSLTGKAIVLILGGLFLIYKSTKEIHHKLEAESDEAAMAGQAGATLRSVIIQVMLLDLVFSLDSVITAVGMAQQLWIMVAANILALGVMLFASKQIAGFVERHPSVKVLALSFLLMIGFVLVIDGFGIHVPKGYIYFAMGFSVFVEAINIRVAKKGKAVRAAAAPRDPAA